MDDTLGCYFENKKSSQQKLQTNHSSSESNVVKLLISLIQDTVKDWLQIKPIAIVLSPSKWDYGVECKKTRKILNSLNGKIKYNSIERVVLRRSATRGMFKLNTVAEEFVVCIEYQSTSLTWNGHCGYKNGCRHQVSKRSSVLRTEQGVSEPVDKGGNLLGPKWGHF